MSVKVIETAMVYPAEKTPRKSLWLSKLDMIVRQPFSHTRILFIYPYSNNVPTNTDINTFFDVNVLKNALSKVAVPFYPLAGRLHVNENNGRYEINCNEEGVLFVEAETINCSLVDLGDEFAPNSNLQKELNPECDYSKGISTFPLLMLQITRLKCGGVTLGVAMHHHVGDGVAHMHCMNSWASLARGVEPSVMPCHDRALFLAPRQPFKVAFRHLEYEPSFQPVLPSNTISGEINKTTTDQVFRLSKDQINLLKLITSPEAENDNISTFKVIAAHVWRSVCKARGLADDQDVKLYIHTDGRSRLKDPTLPRGYFGNVIFSSCCVAKAEDLIHNPLRYTIGEIDEAVKRTSNPNYFRSAIDYLESKDDLRTLVRGPHNVASPNFQINSWTRLPFSEVDFGWGAPQFTSYGESKYEGQSKIIPSLSDDRSVYVAIRLFKSHMDLFRECLYDFQKLQSCM